MNEAKTLVIRGNLVDIINRRTFGAEISILNGHIGKVTPTGQDEGYYLLPGFIDAHVHIESSMVTPAAFIHAAVRHGSIGAVADPHEIANVMGTEGVEYMLDNAKGIPFYTWFGVPSCVPATIMETSGAIIDADETARLLEREDLHFLAEMMNYPGVLNKDPEVMRKIEAAKKAGKPIDGHYPLATGPKLKAYIESGISTDHETIYLEKGREKCEFGMHVLIREGSAAKNFDALHPLLKEYPEQIMFCTDDAHPSFLNKGHINRMVKKSLDLGYDLYDVLRAASYNPAMHYKIPAGFLREGDSADFIQVNNLKNLTIQATYIQGTCVYDGEKCTLPFHKPILRNNFHTKPIPLEKLNRYQTAPPAIAFIKGTGLKLGAIAQSISHDSHNIIAIGVTDFELMQAINAVIKAKGGIAVSCMDEVTLLPLPVAGLMSDESLEETSRRYEEIEEKIKWLKTPMDSLQMTLSFMGLLVIPSLKLSNKGLFNSETFQFTSLFV